MPEFNAERYRVKSREAAPVLPIPAGPRFFFAHHPLAWDVEDVDGQPRWLPQLRRIKVVRGVNGVKDNGDDRQMRFAMQQRGWRIIDNNGPAGEYAFPVAARGGTAWLDKWTSPSEYAPGRVKMKQSAEQRKAYNEWRASLVETGALPEPEQDLIDEVIEQYEDSHINRHLARSSDPVVAQRIEKARAHVERMKAATVHAPKSKRGK